MFADHLWVVFPETFPFWFRGVGRLAWPLFAFLLAEGFRHTKSPENFLMRLLAFALISEIPFDLAMGNKINFAAKTNIFYTLFLGGMVICLYERLKKRRGWQTMAVIGAVLPTAILAEILSADYGGMGVLFVFAMYAVKPKPARMIAFCVLVMSQFIPLVVAYSMGIAIPFEYLLLMPFALAAVPVAALYNGERGVRAKWLFYLAYPVHLAILAVVAAIII
jgi:hypothetical protein